MSKKINGEMHTHISISKPMFTSTDKLSQGPEVRTERGKRLIKRVP